MSELAIILQLFCFNKKCEVIEFDDNRHKIIVQRVESLDCWDSKSKNYEIDLNSYAVKRIVQPKGEQ